MLTVGVVMGNAAEVRLVFYESKSFCENNRRSCAAFEKRIKKCEGCTIKRLFYEENLKDFRKSKGISLLIGDAGLEMLPATVVNGRIAKIEEYPGTSELRKYSCKQTGV